MPLGLVECLTLNFCFFIYTVRRTPPTSQEVHEITYEPALCGCSHKG